YAESMLSYVEAHQLGTLVGSTTAGANGDIVRFDTLAGFYVVWSGMRVTRHDGSPFHREGVRPHVEVHPTLAGLRAGRDEVLEAGLGVVRAAPVRYIGGGGGGGSPSTHTSSVLRSWQVSSRHCRSPRHGIEPSHASPARSRATQVSSWHRAHGAHWPSTHGSPGPGAATHCTAVGEHTSLIARHERRSGLHISPEADSLKQASEPPTLQRWPSRHASTSSQGCPLSERATQVPCVGGMSPPSSGGSWQ